MNKALHLIAHETRNLWDYLQGRGDGYRPNGEITDTIREIYEEFEEVRMRYAYKTVETYVRGMLYAFSDGKFGRLPKYTPKSVQNIASIYKRQF